jgi:AcrR family transcriptional regulator
MGIAERKEREKEQRRKAIVDAAEKVFFSKGSRHSSMEEVAHEAELSKGTLYLYFSCKEELQFAITTRGLNLLYLKLRETFNEKQTGAENLFEIGKTYVRFSREYPDYFKAIIFFESSSLENLDPALREKLIAEDSPLTIFLKAIEQGKKDGTIRDDMETMEMGKILWTQLTGTLQFILYRPKLFDLLGFSEDEMLINHFRIVQDGIIRNTKVI